MLIELDDSIMYYFQENNILSDSNAMEALSDIISASRHRKHIIIASVKLLEYFIDFKGISDLEKKELTHIHSLNYKYLRYKELVKKRLIVYAGDPPKDAGDNYIADLLCLSECDRSVLITENSYDFDFYKALIREMLAERDVPVDIELKSSPCGGSQADVIADNEFIKYGRFTLMIMDSDKDHAEDSSGNSSKKAKKFYNKHKNDPNKVIDYYELKVREKENLLPASLCMLAKNAAQFCDLFKYLKSLENDKDAEEFLRFLDIKDGIRKKKLKNKTFISKYKIYLDEMITRGIMKSSDDVENDDDKCFNGIGQDFLTMYNKRIFLKGIETNIERMEAIIKENEKDDLSSNLDGLKQTLNDSRRILELVPDYIKPDWNDIYEKLVIFGCVIPDNIKTNF